MNDDRPKGFFKACPCKKCGRYRRLTFRPWNPGFVDRPRPEWYTVIESDGVIFVASAECGLCVQKLAVKRAEHHLMKARERLAKMVAHANAMHQKYKPK